MFALREQAAGRTPTFAAFMSGKVIAPAPPCGEEEHQLCRSGHWPLAGVEVYSKGEAGCSYLGSTVGWGSGGDAGRPSEKRAVVSKAPPPSLLHQNPTRSHPSSRHRCHGAFVAARQVAEIKDPKICSAGGRRGFDAPLKHLLITDSPPSALHHCPGSGSCDVGCVEPSRLERSQPPTATTIF